MIDWLNEGKKQNPQKSLDQNLTPKKSHAEFPSHKNFQKALNDFLAQNIETLVLNTPKNPYLNQATPPPPQKNKKQKNCQIFLPPQNPENWKFQTQKISLIISVTWNPE